MYTIYDSITKTSTGSYKTRRMANVSADRKNNAYGAYRYIVRPI